MALHRTDGERRFFIFHRLSAERAEAHLNSVFGMVSAKQDGNPSLFSDFEVEQRDDPHTLPVFGVEAFLR